MQKQSNKRKKYINSQHGDTERTYIYRYIKYIHKADFLKNKIKYFHLSKNI